MTANDFRRLALSFPKTEERAHMHHPDFRVVGKIFATLGYPEDGWAMVKLTPLEQEMFVKAQPAVFNPCTGAWGRRGCTNVRLKFRPQANYAPRSRSRLAPRRSGDTDPPIRRRSLRLQFCPRPVSPPNA